MISVRPVGRRGSVSEKPREISALVTAPEIPHVVSSVLYCSLLCCFPGPTAPQFVS